MSPPDLEVVGVVARRDLERAGAEVRLHVLVSDDRHLAIDFLERRQRVEPIHRAGHDDVENDGGGTLRVVPLDRFFGTAERDRLITAFGQEGAQEVAHRQVVIDDHHLRASVGGRPRPMAVAGCERLSHRHADSRAMEVPARKKTPAIGETGDYRRERGFSW